eukprot:10880748-Ditylum_brightwellii.AAC.1
MIKNSNNLNSSDQSLDQTSTLATAVEPNVSLKPSSFPTISAQRNGTTQFVTCDSNGHISADRTFSTDGLSISDNAYNISYSYSVISATDGSDFVNTLETKIIDTMASSMLDCNRVAARNLDVRKHHEIQRVLMAIDGLKYTDSATLLN